VLTQLSIKNYAVVQALEIEFDDGLTVISGETGAGKSIMVDALGLILGDRADTAIIRTGTPQADLTACFDVSQSEATRLWLAAHDYDNNDCILRRVVTREGRSRAYINGSPATLSQLAALGGTLVDIHSQHEHQSLLKKATHRTLLDNFAGSSKLAKDVEKAYQCWHDTKKQLALLASKSGLNSDHYELLSYQLEELNNLGIVDGEMARLENDQSRLANAEKILQLGQQVLSLCNDQSSDDNGQSANDQLGLAVNLCESIQDEDNALLTDALELLKSALIQVNEASFSLNNYLSQIEINPEKLQQVEQRISDIYNIARKHKVNSEELATIKQTLEVELVALENAESAIQGLTEEISRLESTYREQAQLLTKQRQGATQDFEQQIAEHLHSLGMQGARFVVALNALADDAFSSHGREDVEFLVSTNPGQTPRPLNKVASGGELSRISLAIQVISAQTTPISTLIFDEVDVGIGGATAEIVGDLLRALGRKGQVVCVTHQPQVASKAHQHLLVSKRSQEGSTDSEVKILSSDEKIHEVARMLGGIKLTKQTLAHAEEMLAND
jgi:DNA repair protein RecN (Recombination protein N)